MYLIIIVLIFFFFFVTINNPLRSFMEEKWPLTELMNLNVKNFENKDLLRLFFDRDKKKKKKKKIFRSFS